MEQYYSYLNDLRDSGVTNMFGASPYLQEEFGLSRYEAKTVLMSWMKSFSAVASKTESGQ
jgi:hypothetical protein